MLFQDRENAARQLLQRLAKYKSNSLVVVLGLPRGGVVLAKVIAEGLGAPLEIVVSRKLGAPYNPEFAIGAVAEEGEIVLNDKIVHNLGIEESYIARESQSQLERIKVYLNRFRPGRTFKGLNLAGKILILVDDGIATGYTMLAAVKAVKTQKPQKIVIAVPVAAPDSLQMLQKEVNEAVCIMSPLNFAAVGQFYQSFPQVSDEEVQKLLRKD